MIGNESVYTLFLSPIDISMSILFLLVILIFTLFQSNKQESQLLKKRYRQNVCFKLILGMTFSSYYIFILKGGDTTAYWQCTGILKKYLIESPERFWKLINVENTWENFRGFFNSRLGYPPRWIYMEKESFFISKLLIPLRIITLDSYIATTLILSFWMANANWKVYLSLKNIPEIQSKYLIGVLLFIPSVSFWATGISKDTFSIISIFYILHHFFDLIRKQSKNRSFSIFSILLFSYILFQIRPFILAVVIGPICIMYLLNISHRFNNFKLLKHIYNTILFTGVIGLLFIGINRYFTSENLSNSASLNDAITIQNDFRDNKETYGSEQDKRYNLNITDTSPLSLIKVVPITIITGFYRPFIWEALRPSLILNGIESVVFLYMTLLFFINSPVKRLKLILNNPILVFLLIFVLLMAFITGFTSILFGVLIRLRAPLLPFLGLLLLVNVKKTKPK